MSSPWAKYQAQTWKKKMDEFGGLDVTFRESGSAAALVDIVFGQVTGASKDLAVAELVTTSVIDPILSREEFAALSLGHKLALFTEVMTHVKQEEAPDFPSASTPGGASAPTSETSPEEESETLAGGPGERLRPSVSTRRKS